MAISWASESDSLLAYFSAREVVSQRIVELVRVNASALSEQERASAWAELWAAAENGSSLAACGCLGYLARRWNPDDCTVTSGEVVDLLIARGERFGYFARAKLHEKGLLGNVNQEAAMRDFSAACWGLRGFPPAATHLSSLLMGQGKRQAAKRYAMRGDILGDSCASLLLASWYEEGLIDGARDLSKALCWYERSSRKGNFLATDRLIRVYQHGELGVGVDPERVVELSQTFNDQVNPGNPGLGLMG